MSFPVLPNKYLGRYPYISAKICYICHDSRDYNLNGQQYPNLLNFINFRNSFAKFIMVDNQSDKNECCCGKKRKKNLK